MYTSNGVDLERIALSKNAVFIEIMTFPAPISGLAEKVDGSTKDDWSAFTSAKVNAGALSLLKTSP